MERLTKRDGNFVTVGKKPRGFLGSTEYCKSAFKCPNVSDRTCPYLKMIDRLAAYEDTGLEPEEVAKIREDVENGYMKSTARRYGISVARLRELAQADREGRCVVLNMPRKPLVWGDDDQNACLCPYCGRDLMGIPYGERMVLQCPECGQYLDATKVITRDEAEDALRREQDG